MPISRIESLVHLISSMSKAEKRHFTLQVQRLASNKGALYLSLFQTIDRQKHVKEDLIIRQLFSGKRVRYVNAKRSLYSRILASLRQMRDDKDQVAEVRRLMDFAELLYKKGLINDSLQILGQAKQKSKLTGDNLLILEILQRTKEVESKHITRSRKMVGMVEQLISESASMAELVSMENHLANLALEAQGMYIKWGFAKNQRDDLMYQAYFLTQLPALEKLSDSPKAKVRYYQCKVWSHYARLNFHWSYRYALAWVNEAEASTSDMGLILRGYHYLLTSCFYLNRQDRFNVHFKRLHAWRETVRPLFSALNLLQDLAYYENAVLNHHVINNQYKGIDRQEAMLLDKLKSNSAVLDSHRSHLFTYKLAMIDVYRGQYDKAVFKLNQLLGSDVEPLRSDLFSHARLLLVITHYRLNNFALVMNLIRSVRHSFEMSDRYTRVVDLMLTFLRRGSQAMNFGISDLIDNTIEKMEMCQEDRFQKVDFIYFDFINLLKSIKTGSTLTSVIALSTK